MGPRVLTGRPALPSPSFRAVVVGGVTVSMFEDGKPSSTLPMRVALGMWAESEFFSAEQVARLHLAGVGSLPLYESEAAEAGIEWVECPEDDAA